MQVDRSAVRSARQRRAWTQAKLAEKAQVDERTVQRVERTGRASLPTLQAIAGALELDPSLLIASNGSSSARGPSRSPELSGTRRAAFRTFAALTFLALGLLLWEEFGNPGWPEWQLWFLCLVAAAVALWYAVRGEDHRIIGLIALVACVSMLWYFPRPLLVSVFSAAAFLTMWRPARGSAGKP